MRWGDGGDVGDAGEAGDEPIPIWTAFGDLMACLFGMFVLFFVWVVALQGTLDHDLKTERARREAESARLATLEEALAQPLAEGRITLSGGRIGIQGNVLFDLSSAALKPEGAALLRELAPPIARVLQARSGGAAGELLMVSGFTDDVPVRGGGAYADNWELSAERALTVTRTLVASGIAPEALFAAGFGDTHPLVPNTTDGNRARNRRVEMALVPRAGAREAK